MAGKISDLSAATPVAADYVEILDVSDTAMGGSGSNKKSLVSDVLALATRGGNGVVCTATKTGNYTAVAGDLVVCNTAGGAFTVTLPASPTAGMRVGAYLLTAGNNLTVGRNSQSIDGAASDLTISAAGTLRTLQYNGTQWLTVQAAGESVLGSAFNLTSTGTYQDTGLAVSLPTAGVYLIGYNARGQLQASGGTVPYYILAQLYDATAAAAVANTERIVILTVGTVQVQGQGAFTAAIHVAQATSLKLYAGRFVAGGSPTWATAAIQSDTAGRATLNYQRVG